MSARPTEGLGRLAATLLPATDAAFRNALRLLGQERGIVSALWLNLDGWRLTAVHPKTLSLDDSVTAAVAGWAPTLRGPARWKGNSPPVAGLSLRGRAPHVAWALGDGPDRVGVWVTAGPSAEGLAPAVPLFLIAARCRALQAPRGPQPAEPTVGPAAHEEFMAAVLDALTLGVYVVDRDYRIVALNQARETGHQGISRKAAVGRSVFDVLHREPREKLKAELDEVFETGSIRTYEVETTGPGERRRYRLTKVPMRLAGADRVTHIIATGEDVTEQRRIQEQIAHAEKLTALGQMVAGVMHEINNPLATIAACVDSLRERPAEEHPDLLSMIDTEVSRCKNIARDLLAFSRPPPTEKGIADVQEAVEETLRLLQHHERFRKIRVHREYVYDLPPVWADAERLIQVFVALCLNALDAMGDDGELRVRTEVVDDHELAISFIDSGCGIAPGDLPTIFEPFYTTKPPGKGTGLGLFICYGIIAEHDGQIEVDSTLGVGSNFRVVLPTTAPKGEPPNAEQIRAPRKESNIDA